MIRLPRRSHALPLITALLTLCGTANVARAAENTAVTPDAATRSYADNFKDLALSRCIAQAYQAEQRALADARVSSGAISDWTQYDDKGSADALSKLINRYLSRNYQSIDVHYRDVRLDLLKCVDLYHSRELNDLAKRYVDKPTRSYQQDHGGPAPSTP